MKMYFVLFLMGLVLVFPVYGSTEKAAPHSKKPDLGEIPAGNVENLKLDTQFAGIPLYFISNKGQVNKQAKFYARASRYTLWLTKQGLVFDSIMENKVKVKKDKFSHSPHSPYSPHSTNSPGHLRDVSRLVFVNANKNPEMIPVDETKLRVNYFIGNDRSKWHCNIPTSQAVLYKNLYKHIDLKVYGIEKQIEYDWIVKPGGNPAAIRFAYKNVKATRIDDDGNLLIETDFGRLIHKKPVCYQRIDVERRGVVNGTFKKVGKDTYGFNVSKYDKRFELIIDPVVLTYSTYLGGGRRDRIHGIAVDGSGNAYVAGYTDSNDFPIRNEYNYWLYYRTYDAFVTKIDTTQSGFNSLIYSTFLGGWGSDHGYGIAVDDKANVYVTGETNSLNFPTLNQYQEFNSFSYSAFLTKIDTTRSGASSLIYSTRLGGDYHDKGFGAAIDNSGYAYVTGETLSSNFPILHQYQEDQGGSDVFLTKIDTTQSGAAGLIYSTYLGGGWDDSGQGIAVDVNGSGYAYVTGYTDSSDFPTLGQLQTNQPGRDAFLAKIDTTQSGASSLIYSTYLGGDGEASGQGIAVDVNGSGYAYVTGHTFSMLFPSLGQYQGYQGYGDVFVTKIDTTQSGTSGLIYSTFLGGDTVDYGRGIAVDLNRSGTVYVTGYTASSNFPTRYPYQLNQEDFEHDVFVTKIDTNLSGDSSLIYSTYLGGVRDDWGYAIAVDSNGYAYVAGATYSLDFPTLGQYQNNHTGLDAFVTRLIKPTPPYVITRPVFSVTTTSASGGGDVTSDGGEPITARGICWSTSPLPTLSDNITTNGTGTGAFTSSMTGLTPNTLYYVRAYAINAAGTAYGNEVTFTTSSAAPSLTVTSPNGGESWQFGSTQNITWTAQNVYGRLVITLWKKGILVGTIAKNIDPSSGSYTWTVGNLGWSAIPPGTDFKIKIKETGTTVSDMSDNPFALTLNR